MISEKKAKGRTVRQIDLINLHECPLCAPHRSRPLFASNIPPPLFFYHLKQSGKHLYEKTNRWYHINVIIYHLLNHEENISVLVARDVSEISQAVFCFQFLLNRSSFIISRVILSNVLCFSSEVMRFKIIVLRDELCLQYGD